MLPIYARVICVPRSKYLPSHNRKIPVPRNPTTLGGQLRRRRLQLGIFQSQAARQLRVSTRTLSLWEGDKIYPAWNYQPRLIAYLGYDPFTDPTLGRPKGNETIGVAIFSNQGPPSFGLEVRRHRLARRLNRKKCALILGVSAKTLWGWETGRHEASERDQQRILEILGGR